MMCRLVVTSESSATVHHPSDGEAKPQNFPKRRKLKNGNRMYHKYTDYVQRLKESTIEQEISVPLDNNGRALHNSVLVGPLG